MTHVLIAGGGPTGLTLAIELARRDVDFRIVDRSPEPPKGSRGKGLQPRTLEVFHDLGVIDEILATGTVYPPMRAYKGGEVVWEGRMHAPKEPDDAVPYPMVIMQPQWRTERILRDRLARLGKEVEFGVEVTGLAQDQDGVTVTLDGGETVRCAYLVGADGGRSTVRRLCGIGFHGDTFDSERMLLGDVRTDDLDHDHWHVWGDMATRTLHAGLCPLPGTDLFQFYATHTGEEDFQKILDRQDAGVRIKEVTWRSEYRVNIRMAERFRDGRVFLAGDAAHVHSPAGGQGLNTGVQDAYNLGWKLAHGAEWLLDTYEAERVPIAEHVLGLSTRLLREKDLERDEETQQLNLGYRDSPLSVGERGGERLPGRLEELRGTHFTLYADGVRVDDPRVRTLPAITDGVLLVRPDGYIGYDGDGSDLSAYLSGLGISTG
ncbi:FAD-dependent monooxygenase [Thermoactinospora rubra]|uniref:FAD-dependent monooxygenase n=1 Tax=Thermoactinospora rubra TaxID=1088767 RepID=UPI000A10FC48|nr:FAD-dependent monooxygenase [Thermoactinospora rubra]